MDNGGKDLDNYIMAFSSINYDWSLNKEITGMDKIDSKRLEILRAKIGRLPKRWIQKLQQELDKLIKGRSK